MFLLFINFEESIIILFIALIIFGPKKIPEVARSIGNGVKYFKNISQHFKKEIGEVCDQIEDFQDSSIELDNNIKGTIHRK
jgi:TatA/E family protein of Tat protein translocase